jgi:hypothetical protein
LFIFLFLPIFIDLNRVCPLLELLSDAAFQQPLMKHLFSIGSQFIGFRDEANALKGNATLFLMARFFAAPIFVFR